VPAAHALFLNANRARTKRQPDVTVKAPCGHDVPAGHRFCGHCGTPLDPLRTSDDPQDRAERRLITVLFCDLIGSTALSSRLDPEDLRGLLMLYHAACTKMVNQYGGYVAQHLGDGVLAYFGYPSAHEDDARRAVTAALEIVRIVPNVRYHTVEGSAERLGVRIGIDTGLTIAGQVGAGASRQSLALGETPNIAARLQSITPHNSIVISSETHRLVSDSFEFAALGLQRLRGVGREIDAYQVLSGTRSGVHAPASAQSRSQMIGRAAELARVLVEFERAANGEASLALVTGAAGIGKSRLLHTVYDTLEGRELRWLGANCLPFYTNTSFYAAQSLLEQLANIDRHDSNEQQLERWRVFLEGIGSGDSLPLIATALGLRAADDSAEPRLSPQAWKERTLEAIVAILRAVARDRPLVLAIEDVHWADPSTLELLQMLTSSSSGVGGLMTILTFRSDFSLPWTPSVEPIVLASLAAHEGRALLRAVARHDEIPESTIAEILRRSDGIPIYIEELTKHALTSLPSTDGKQAAAESSTRAHEGTVPMSIRGSLAAQLDRLGPAKLVAQLAATVAGTFDEGMIASVIEQDTGSLRAALTSLVDADILIAVNADASRRVDASVGDGGRRESYQFRHALLQEVAYDSLLKKTRQTYHARIARALEAGSDDDVKRRPEFVAHHWSEAKCPGQALPHLVSAAEQSAQRYANVEAAAFYAQAIASLERMVQSGDDASERWRHRHSALLECLGDTLALLVQRERAEAVYRDAIAHVPEDERLAPARLLRKIGVVLQQQPDRALAVYDEAARCLGVDHPAGDEEWRREWVSLQLARLRSHYWFNEVDRMMELVGVVQPYIEEFATALQRADFFNQLTLVAVRRERYAVSAATLGHARDYVRAARETADLTEIASACLTLGVVLFCHGDCSESVAELREALILARKAGHPTFEIRCLTYLCAAHRRLGHVDETTELCRELLRLATEKHMVEYAGMAHSNLAWAALAQGDRPLAAHHGQSALVNWEAFQVPYPFQWTARLPLLVLCVEQGRLDAACDHARVMLRSEQHALPQALMGALEALVRNRDAGDEGAAGEALTRVVALAQALDFVHLPRA
jgi:class 3 adenylate cyclase/tetratricopeptide (TPR) repeat protein